MNSCLEYSKTQELRNQTALALQLVGEATGKSTARLLSGVLDKLQPPLAKRRLLPLRHVPQQTGYAAGLTYCLQQKPPLLALSAVGVGPGASSDTGSTASSGSLTLGPVGAGRGELDPRLPDDMRAGRRAAGADADLQRSASWHGRPVRDAQPVPVARLRSHVVARLPVHAVAAAASGDQGRRQGGEAVPDDPAGHVSFGLQVRSCLLPHNRTFRPPAGHRRALDSVRRDNGELGQLRNSITQMLFKQLTSPDKTAVKHAQDGLSAIITHQKMPKQLLQSSLRPILVNLAYYNKLKLPLLHGLERLLQLLASWFNVTLGGLGPLPVQVDTPPGAGSAWEVERSSWCCRREVDRPPAKVAGAGKAGGGEQVLGPLARRGSRGRHPRPLPPAALPGGQVPRDRPGSAPGPGGVSFAGRGGEASLTRRGGSAQERPGLVVLTIELEKALGQTAHNMQSTKMWSPYRQPLAKYLNKYAAEVRRPALPERHAHVTRGALWNTQECGAAGGVVFPGHHPDGNAQVLLALSGHHPLGSGEAAARSAGCFGRQDHSPADRRAQPQPAGTCRATSGPILCGACRSLRRVQPVPTRHLARKRWSSWLQVQQLQSEAQFRALHLLAAVVKLLPAWLPADVFALLHTRWKSPERKTRHAFSLSLPSFV